MLRISKNNIYDIDVRIPTKTEQEKITNFLILLDKKSINMTPAIKISSSNLVYSANGSDVLTTICNGQILMEDKKILCLNEDKVKSLANEAILEMKNL